MVNQKDVKKWFCCLSCCLNLYGYNTFVEGCHGKNYKENKINIKQNRLPICEDDYYQPDVILEDIFGKIRFIIEIEGVGKSSPVRKGITGAILLADYCISKLQNEKFNMLFIACADKDICQIQARINVAKEYCWKNINEIRVCDFESFKNYPLGILNCIFPLL